MSKYDHVILIHGLEGSSQGFKAQYLREILPGILTPDFPGTLGERMEKLRGILEARDDWVIIGSSFGGLMGALYTCAHPEKVRKLILLAPALLWPDFSVNPPAVVDVPTMVYHGMRDELLPIDEVRRLAERTFNNLIFHEVDDIHKLHETVKTIDWREIIET